MEFIKIFLDAWMLGLTGAIDFWIALYKSLSFTDIGNILIYTAGLIWGIELIPQLKKTHKTKNVKGISLSFFVASLIAYALYMIGNGFLNNWNLIIAHMPSLILTFWMVILIIKYRRN